MKLTSLQAAEKKLVLQTYDRNPKLFTGGHGVHLRDESGVEYLDLLSGIGVCALGYGHPAIENAIATQSKQLLHVSNLFYQEHTAPLALKLTEMTGLDRAFFCNSGTEAWEAALKLARAHATLLRSEGKNIGTKILALEHSFHGRTMGAVATTHKAKYREPFMPVMPGVEFVPMNDVAALRAAFSSGSGNDVCAIAVEILQGEGGIHSISKEFLSTAKALCTSTGALLLADEIQSGMGRTGKWCAYQHYGIIPDVITLAKPLAGGLPMGAMLCNEEAARALHAGMHGTTFGGGPLVCAVALAVIDTIEKENLLAHVTEVGDYFLAQLHTLAKKHSAIVDVRGTGLMLGIELNSDELAKSVAAQMLDRNIIINRTSETVLRFLPPYILQRKHVDTAIAALDELIALNTNAGAVLAGEHTNG